MERRMFRVAKLMAKSRKDIVGMNCVKDLDRKIMTESSEIKDVWRKSLLLNEENSWDKHTTCEKEEGPCELIRKDEILKALRMMNKGKAARPTGVVTEMIIADENLGVKWLTDLCNLTVAEGRIPEDWTDSVLLPVFKGTGIPWNVEVTGQ